MAGFLDISFKQPEKLQSIEVFHTVDGTVRYTIVWLKVSGNRLEIYRQERTDDYEALLALLDRKTPVSLLFTGKGVLRKAVSNGNNNIQELVPGTDANHFLWNRFSSDLHELFLSRREGIETLCSQLKDEGFLVVNVAIGNGAVSVASGYLPEGTHRGSDATYIIESGKAFITEKENINPTTLTVGNFLLNSDTIPAFAAGYHYFSFDEDEHIGNTHSVTQQAREDLRYKKRIKLAGTIALVSLFVILLGNFLWFDSLSKRKEQLGSEAGANRSVLEKLDSLQKLYDEKSAFVTDAGLNEEADMAWIADRIGSKVPDNVTLTSLNLFPIEKNSNVDEGWLIQNGMIVTEGQAIHPVWVNEFVERLKEFTWIRDVEIGHFRDDKPDETGVFKLIITIAERV